MENLLIVVWGIVQSLAFTFLPGLSKWYENLGAGEGDEVAKKKKRFVQGAVLFVVAVALFGLSCAGVEFNNAPVCSANGFWTVILAYLAALGANQTTHWFTTGKK